MSPAFAQELWRGERQQRRSLLVNSRSVGSTAVTLAIAPIEEGGDDLGELPGGLLGDEMAAGNLCRGEILGPCPPNVGCVRELGLVLASDEQHWAGDAR